MSIQNIIRIETYNNRVVDLMQLEGEYCIDSRIVAHGLDIEHESFMRTLKTYQADIEHFGLLRFQIGVKEGNRGGEQPKYAMLNRDQVLFAITLSRNTEQVIEWKKAIIDALSQLDKQVKQQASHTHTRRVGTSANKPPESIETTSNKRPLEEKIICVARRLRDRNQPAPSQRTFAAYLNMKPRDILPLLQTLAVRGVFRQTPGRQFRSFKFELIEDSEQK